MSAALATLVYTIVYMYIVYIYEFVCDGVFMQDELRMYNIEKVKEYKMHTYVNVKFSDLNILHFLHS